MASTTQQPTSFVDAESRADDMHRTIEHWIQDLGKLVKEAQASEKFLAWLDFQSRFHTYSARNTLLIKQQCPEATRVAGYRTWQREFNRHVKPGEQGIWIWAPIFAKRCPTCEHSRSYHEEIGCEEGELPPEEWPTGLVGFKPVAVFDVSQTEGEPLPTLDTGATGEPGDLLPRLIDAADALEVTVRIVDEASWTHGEAMGVCEIRDGESPQPLVKVKDRSNEADLCRTLIHEYAHAHLHREVDEVVERGKREVEAEAVAYVVGRYVGLDTRNSAFYLAAWQGEESGQLLDRLERISSVAKEIISVVTTSQ